MAELMHHWRNEFKSNYLGSHLLTDGQDKILTIKKVVADDLQATDGTKKHSLVAYFVENELPMVLNKTNCRIIAKMLKENDYTKWAGHRIAVYVDHNVKAFGDVVDGLRIRPKVPEDVKVACEECGQILQPAFNMAASQLAAYTKKKYGKTLCADCATAKAEAAKAPAKKEG